MSYYNYILKPIKVSSEDLSNYLHRSGYTLYLEGHIGFSALKEVVGLSTTYKGKGAIVLQDVPGGSDMLRPCMLRYPEGTWISDANHFIKVCDIESLIRLDEYPMSKSEIAEHVSSYTQYLDGDDVPLIIMAF